MLNPTFRPTGYSPSLSALLIAVVLAGCAATVKDPSAPKVTPVTTVTTVGTVDDLLRRSEQLDANESTALQLTAAAMALDAGDAAQAQQILDLISEAEVAAASTLEYLLLSARTATANDLPVKALSILNDTRLKSAEMTRDLQAQIGLLRSQAYRSNRSFLASARERMYLDTLFQGDARAANHEAILATLLEVPARSLASQASKAITSDLRGWLSLAAMTRQYQNDPLRQLQELNKWQRAWPHHPAASVLPRSLTMLSTIVSEQPTAIALVLPFQGDMSANGRAIRDGFLAAHYEQRGTADVFIYDSSSANVVDLVTQAQMDGAELVIGPLSKDAVTQLAPVDLGIPVLALNRTHDNSLNANLYQFGLAPEDEIHQVVNQVYSEGLKNALVIYQEGEWGDRNFRAFESGWQKLGGNIIDSAVFADQRDYSDLVKELLKVDQSEQRARDLQSIIGERFEFTPRRRQDIDFVFLLAGPGQARGINPALERFYADDIPIYATSHIHELGESWLEAIDLNRIRFCDMPWKLTTDDRTQSSVQSAWSAAQGQLAPFFALGVDAQRLYPRLQQLREVPSDKLFGATGVLRLNPQNVIERELMWAQFRNGKPIAAPLVVQ